MILLYFYTIILTYIFVTLTPFIAVVTKRYTAKKRKRKNKKLELDGSMVTEEETCENEGKKRKKKAVNTTDHRIQKRDSFSRSSGDLSSIERPRGWAAWVLHRPERTCQLLE